MANLVWIKRVVKGRRKTSISKTDWLDMGLGIVAKHGHDGIIVERLCEGIGRSKGSFYFHFKGRDGYIADLLGHWEQILTRDIINAAEGAPTPLAKLKALGSIVSATNMAVERNLRHWAGSDENVKTAVALVDQKRLDYMVHLIRAIKHISPQQARDLAMMNYAILIGGSFMHIAMDEGRRGRIERVQYSLLNQYPDRDN